MGANPEHWLDRLLAERGERLRSFLRRRARPGTEIADLSQEIYLRLLRVPEPEAIANPEAYLFTVAGNLLPPKCRTTVVLHYRDGMTCAEIGAQLGVSGNMAKKYLAKALAHCRRRMGSLA